MRWTRCWVGRAKDISPPRRLGARANLLRPLSSQRRRRSPTSLRVYTRALLPCDHEPRNSSCWESLEEALRSRAHIIIIVYLRSVSPHVPLVRLCSVTTRPDQAYCWACRLSQSWPLRGMHDSCEGRRERDRETHPLVRDDAYGKEEIAVLFLERDFLRSEEDFVWLRKGGVCKLGESLK